MVKNRGHTGDIAVQNSCDKPLSNGRGNQYDTPSGPRHIIISKSEEVSHIILSFGHWLLSGFALRSNAGKTRFLTMNQNTLRR